MNCNPVYSERGLPLFIYFWYTCNTGSPNDVDIFPVQNARRKEGKVSMRGCERRSDSFHCPPAMSHLLYEWNITRLPVP